MARFTYECDNCHKTFKVSLERRYATHPCPHTVDHSPSQEEPCGGSHPCGGTGTPVYATGAVKVMERLDNGAMARAVERVHNIEEIVHADADAHGVKDEEDA